MTDSGTVDIHIGPYDYMNNIPANLGYHVVFPLLHDILQNLVCIGILLSHHHAHYTVAPVTGFVLLSR
jgi:hypothetical protein